MKFNCLVMDIVVLLKLLDSKACKSPSAAALDPSTAFAFLAELLTASAQACSAKNAAKASGHSSILPLQGADLQQVLALAVIGLGHAESKDLRQALFAHFSALPAAAHGKLAVLHSLTGKVGTYFERGKKVLGSYLLVARPKVSFLLCFCQQLFLPRPVVLWVRILKRGCCNCRGTCGSLVTRICRPVLPSSTFF